MNIYIELEDERFIHLSSLLSKDYDIEDDVEIADVVILGIHNTNFKKSKNNTKVIAFSDVEDVDCINLNQNETYLKKNAYLTALGTLSYLKELNGPIVIYGNGRIATYLNQLLHYKAKVLARHPKDGQFDIKDDAYKQASIIINTIPARLDLDFKSIQHDVKIFDLASDPYGFNHDELKRQGFDVQLLSGIPGRLFPKTSAYILYQEVIKCIKG